MVSIEGINQLQKKKKKMPANSTKTERIHYFR